MLDLNTGIDVLLPYRVIRKHSTDRRPGIQQRRIHIKRQYAFIHQRKNAMAYRLWRNKVQKSLNIISFTITAEVEQINPFKLTGQNIQLETRHQFLSSDIKSLENKINNFWQASRIIPPVSRVPASTVWHEFLVSDGEVYWSSSFLLVAKAGGPDKQDIKRVCSWVGPIIHDIPNHSIMERYLGAFN